MLDRIQRQFGAQITQPLSTPSRFPIYQEQYWMRLFSTLQELFPLLLRLYGPADFNATLAEPYLQAHPPTGWTLASLGTHLPSWIRTQTHLEVVHLAADIDLAFESAFTAAQLPPLQGDPQQLLHQPLQLQPHLHLLQSGRDLLSVRAQFLAQEPDYWLDRPFPEVARGTFHHAIYRNSQNSVVWRTLEPSEYLMLSRLRQGVPLAQACEADEKLPYLVQNWVLQKWLSNTIFP